MGSQESAFLSEVMHKPNRAQVSWAVTSTAQKLWAQLSHSSCTAQYSCTELRTANNTCWWHLQHFHGIFFHCHSCCCNCTGSTQTAELRNSSAPYTHLLEFNFYLWPMWMCASDLRTVSLYWSFLAFTFQHIQVVQPPARARGQKAFKPSFLCFSAIIALHTKPEPSPDLCPIWSYKMGCHSYFFSSQDLKGTNYIPSTLTLAVSVVHTAPCVYPER